MAYYVTQDREAVELESIGNSTSGTAIITGGIEKSFIVRSYPHTAMTEEEALAQVAASVPTTYDSTFKYRTLKISERMAPYAYRVRVSYTAAGSGGGGGGSSLVKRTYSSVNTTIHIQVGLTETVYGDAITFDKAINVYDGETKGIDIDAGYAQMTEEHSKPASAMTSAYIQMICEKFALKGTNNAVFRGFPVRSVRLDTFNIGAEDGGYVPVNFTFLIGKNLTGQTVGSVTGVARDAFDYSWVVSKPIASQGAITGETSSVIVNRVYEPDSFAFIDYMGGTLT